MSTGRRPEPTALKVLRGTNRPDRARPDEPRPAVLLGDKPPAWISGPRARAAWKSLAPMLRDYGLLTVLDAPALGLLVEAFADYVTAREVVEGKRCGLCGREMRAKRPCPRAIDELGNHDAGTRYYTTRTESGSVMIRPHPAAAEKDAAYRRFVKLLVEFGSTPAARARVSAAASESEADPAEEFVRGLG